MKENIALKRASYVMIITPVLRHIRLLFGDFGVAIIDLAFSFLNRVSCGFHEILVFLLVGGFRCSEVLDFSWGIWEMEMLLCINIICRI